MSSLWTPGGDAARRDDPGAPRGEPDDDATASAEEIAALRELHSRLVATPVADVVANHALGLWQLALVHLGVVTPPDESGNPPRADLAAAGLAIDALAALVDGLGTRLGDHEATLRDALVQVQAIYVRVAESSS